MLWASPSSLEADFGPSFSQEGGETTSIPLGTGCGSSSKNKRENLQERDLDSEGKVGSYCHPFLPGNVFFRAHLFSDSRKYFVQSRRVFATGMVPVVAEVRGR